MGAAEDFDPNYQHPIFPNEKYHALYGNSEFSRVVIIGKDQSETYQIIDKIKQNCGVENVDKIFWIQEPYRDNEDWVKIMKENEATNVLIDSGDEANDRDVYEKLKIAYLIPMVMLDGINWT